MKTIRQATPLLLCAVMLFCLCVPVVAQNEGIKEQMPESNIAPCATGRFSMAVSANKLSLANSSFALQQDEIVTINASNTPITASVDFGLVDENGTFFICPEQMGRSTGA